MICGQPPAPLTSQPGGRTRAHWDAMPDDNFRSTHGLPPDSRPTNVPPKWWSQLDREDLPEGQADINQRAANRWNREDAFGRELRGRRHPRWLSGWRRTLVANLTVLLVATILLIVSVAYTSPPGLAAVLLVCGVLALLALLGVNIARRVGRRW